MIFAVSKGEPDVGSAQDKTMWGRPWCMPTSATADRVALAPSLMRDEPIMEDVMPIHNRTPRQEQRFGVANCLETSYDLSEASSTGALHDA